MWQQHLVILGVLLLIAVLVLILDQYLLKPAGGFLPVDLRGMLIAVYAMWLAVHMSVSSLALHLSQTERIYTLHGITALVSVVLVGLGIFAYGQYDNYQSRMQSQARHEQRQKLFDVITLEKWWYVPNAEEPEAIHVVVNVAQPGRFTGGVQGRAGGDEDRQLFSGEFENQLRVEAGARIEQVFKLTRYSDGKADEISFRFYLFTASDNIFKYYIPGPKRRDDGHAFYAAVPAPAPSP